MKVCHIITRLIIGGAQENTLLTCAGLAQRGHEVLLVSGPETGPEGSLWDQAEAESFGVAKVDELRRAIRPSLDGRCVRVLADLLSEERPDIVHTHSSKAGILGRLAAQQAGVPHIVHTIHGMSFNRTQPVVVRTAYRLLERAVGRRTDAFISVCDAMTGQAVAAGIGPGERFTTIYSGMLTDSFGPDAETRRAVRAEWGFREEHVLVGTIARLFRNKGYEELLSALPILAADERLRFVWVGDGRDRHTYVRRLDQMGLRDRVHLTGLVRTDEIPRLLTGFDMLVHASRWEGLPRALPQALLTEVPVVSFDNDGAPEVVEPGVTGELVTFGDVCGLVSAVGRLARDPELRAVMGREGRRRCLERFDHGAMVEQIESLYRRLVR